MSLSFCPLTGSRHSGQGQLSRSQTTGKRSMLPSSCSSRTAPFWLFKGLLQPLDAFDGLKSWLYMFWMMTILAGMRITQRIVVIGGGVLGTMHAVAARRRGYQVVHLEREDEARGASVRNFGLIWVSGRRPGAELALALRARELWAELGAAIDGLCFRPAGSLTLASGDTELRVLKEAASLPDADRRDFELLDPGTVREANPALRGEVAGGLLCRADAIVEPRDRKSVV